MVFGERFVHRATNSRDKIVVLTQQNLPLSTEKCLTAFSGNFLLNDIKSGKLKNTKSENCIPIEDHRWHMLEKNKIYGGLMSKFTGLKDLLVTAWCQIPQHSFRGFLSSTSLICFNCKRATCKILSKWAKYVILFLRDYKYKKLVVFF